MIKNLKTFNFKEQNIQTMKLYYEFYYNCHFVHVEDYQFHK